MLFLMTEEENRNASENIIENIILLTIGRNSISLQNMRELLALWEVRLIKVEMSGNMFSLLI